MTERTLNEVQELVFAGPMSLRDQGNSGGATFVEEKTEPLSVFVEVSLSRGQPGITVFEYLIKNDSAKRLVTLFRAFSIFSIPHHLCPNVCLSVKFSRKVMYYNEIRKPR